MGYQGLLRIAQLIGIVPIGVVNGTHVLTKEDLVRHIRTYAIHE